LWLVLCLAASVSAQFSCGDFSYDSQSAWQSVLCNSFTTVCGIGAEQSPIAVVSSRSATEAQLSRLRFKDYTDGLNTLIIDGQTILYQYSSVTAQLRNLNTAEGVFTPKFFYGTPSS